VLPKNYLEEEIPGKTVLDMFSLEAAMQDPFVRLSVQGQISNQDLRSLFKLSTKDLSTKNYSLNQVSVQDL